MIRISPGGLPSNNNEQDDEDDRLRQKQDNVKANWRNTIEQQKNKEQLQNKKETKHKGEKELEQLEQENLQQVSHTDSTTPPPSPEDELAIRGGTNIPRPSPKTPQPTTSKTTTPPLPPTPQKTPTPPTRPTSYYTPPSTTRSPSIFDLAKQAPSPPPRKTPAPPPPQTGTTQKQQEPATHTQAQQTQPQQPQAQPQQPQAQQVRSQQEQMQQAQQAATNKGAQPPITPPVRPPPSKTTTTTTTKEEPTPGVPSPEQEALLAPAQGKQDEGGGSGGFGEKPSPEWQEKTQLRGQAAGAILPQTPLSSLPTVEAPPPVSTTTAADIKTDEDFVNLVANIYSNDHSTLVTLNDQTQINVQVTNQGVSIEVLTADNRLLGLLSSPAVQSRVAVALEQKNIRMMTMKVSFSNRTESRTNEDERGQRVRGTEGQDNSGR